MENPLFKGDLKMKNQFLTIAVASLLVAGSAPLASEKSSKAEVKERAITVIPSKDNLSNGRVRTLSSGEFKQAYGTSPKLKPVEVLAPDSKISTKGAAAEIKRLWKAFERLQNYAVNLDNRNRALRNRVARIEERLNGTPDPIPTPGQTKMFKNPTFDNYLISNCMQANGARICHSRDTEEPNVWGDLVERPARIFCWSVGAIDALEASFDFLYESDANVVSFQIGSSRELIQYDLVNFQPKTYYYQNITCQYEELGNAALLLSRPPFYHISYRNPSLKVFLRYVHNKLVNSNLGVFSKR
jgi:hypothetical protein